MPKSLVQIASIIFIIRCCYAETTMVSLPHGAIHGQVVNDNVAIFKGIRYGKSERFAVSTVDDHLHTYDGVIGAVKGSMGPGGRMRPSAQLFGASHYGAPCPQNARIDLGAPVSEDCLYLNIWAPVQNETAEEGEKRQVMVFIHGGGYVQGSGNDMYVDGNEYVKKGAILVSLNYRLGIFGFFAHPSLTLAYPDHPTNFGLLDLIVGLQWLKKYIQFFGGNPDDITVFGESAGASAIQWLMAHKDLGSSPLFTRAILQSPPAAAYPYDMKEAGEFGVEFAMQIGCPPPNDLTCLLEKPMEEIIEFFRWHRRGTPSLSTPPIPKPLSHISSPHVDYVNFPVHPSLSGINGEAQNHQIIIGTTNHEWLLFIYLQHIFLQPSDEWMNEAVRLIFSSDHFTSQPTPQLGLSSQLDLLYPVHRYESGVMRVAHIYTHMVFTCPCRRYARKLAGQGANVNAYLFSHEPIHGNRKLKAFHAAELPFVFGRAVPSYLGGMLKLFPDSFTDEERVFSNNIIDLWLRLGKDKLRIDSTFEWPHFAETKGQLLNLSIPFDVIHSDYDKEQCDFWDSVSPLPQKHILFDVFAHEPFMLQLANEYSINCAIFLIKNKFAMLAALGCLILFCCKKIRRKGKKNAGHRKNE